MKSTLVRLGCALFIGFGCVAAPIGAAAQTAGPSPAAAAAKAPRNSSFHGNIDAADAGAKTFTIKGKKSTRTFTITASTKLLKRAGGDATVADLKTGEYISGSAKKTGEGQYEAVNVKVGPKPEATAASAPAATPAATPAASPTPAKKRVSKKAAAAAAAAATSSPAAAASPSPTH